MAKIIITTSHSKLFFLTLLLALSIASITEARPFFENSSRSSLVARLKLDNESSSCWDSLTQLQSCSGELIMFFLNGETNLGPGCCQAIRTISHQCWPAMIGTLGFTAEESDVLQGYCDSEPPHEAPVAEAASARVVEQQQQLLSMDLVP
ncbi:hypothetical protein Pint_07908 [Pistacia integerrima]|uniref:Uncharacterized protein n=1 Tax=Pistacia integerrima TaxID=434235 RepID=A0ACC0XXF3_9ROSI|nr:hypothetical protein Pint_07908 [Pistacia integerrima]